MWAFLLINHRFLHISDTHQDHVQEIRTTQWWIISKMESLQVFWIFPLIVKLGLVSRTLFGLHNRFNNSSSQLPNFHSRISGANLRLATNCVLCSYFILLIQQITILEYLFIYLCIFDILLFGGGQKHDITYQNKWSRQKIAQNLQVNSGKTVVVGWDE